MDTCTATHPRDWAVINLTATRRRASKAPSAAVRALSRTPAADARKEHVSPSTARLIERLRFMNAGSSSRNRNQTVRGTERPLDDPRGDMAPASLQEVIDDVLRGILAAWHTAMPRGYRDDLDECQERTGTDHADQVLTGTWGSVLEGGKNA